MGGFYVGNSQNKRQLRKIIDSIRNFSIPRRFMISWRQIYLLIGFYLIV